MLLAKIHNLFGMLTETEQKIATFILKHPKEAVHLTARQLGEKCGTAPSAVIRFCKSVGMDGFGTLKIALAAELGQSEEPPPQAPSPTEAVFRCVFSSGIGTLRDTLQMLDFRALEAITDLLLRAEKIFIFGVGTSSFVAQDAAYRFSQLGLPAHAYTDILFMNVAAGNMKKGDVAFGISHSGQTKATVEAMRHAAEAGAETVALTSFTGSLLSCESNRAVTVFADEENYPVEAVSARVAHICVIDALMMAIATKKEETLETYKTVRNRMLAEIRFTRKERD